MAVRRAYGVEDPGRWNTFPPGDPDNPKRVVRLRIQKAGPDLRAEMEELFGEEVEGLNGKRTRQLTMAVNEAATRETACRIWTDTLNFWIVAETEYVANALSKEWNETVRVGEEVLLDGRLTRRVKELVLAGGDHTFAVWIVECGTKLREETQNNEEYLEKNSQSSSRPALSGHGPRNSARGAESEEATVSPASPIST